MSRFLTVGAAQMGPIARHETRASTVKRLMTLMTLWLVHRYRADSVHYVTPTEDNQQQAARMKAQGIYASVTTEVGQIIVARVDAPGVAELLNPDRIALRRLITKSEVVAGA